MAVHRVELALPPTDIQTADVVVNVWSDDELLGELRISRGTIDWRPGHHQAIFSMDWERFDEVMRDNARRVWAALQTRGNRHRKPIAIASRMTGLVGDVVLRRVEEVDGGHRL